SSRTLSRVSETARHEICSRIPTSAFSALGNFLSTNFQQSSASIILMTPYWLTPTLAVVVAFSSVCRFNEPLPEKSQKKLTIASNSHACPIQVSRVRGAGHLEMWRTALGNGY